MDKMVHAWPLGSFVGATTDGNKRTEACPLCEGIKSPHAQTCIHCRPARQVKRDAEAMDRHRRFEAALEAGWTQEEMLEAGNPPTRAEIERRKAHNLISAWWNRKETL